MKNKFILFIGFLSIAIITKTSAYPYDGYARTAIARLLRLELIHQDSLKGKLGPVGQYLKMEDIKLNLLDTRIDSLPAVDPELQKLLESIIPNRQKRYSIALLDITPGRPVRYAAQKETSSYQPGSVGKLAILSGMFCELQNIYPDDFDKRIALLKTKRVSARDWALTDSHTIPLFDVEKAKYSRRRVKESDVFSLFEWIDHMVSVSNNGAASVVWRELILMREFGEDYPTLTEEKAEDFLRNEKRKVLTEIAMDVVNGPLRDLGISDKEWRLGSLFTHGGKKRVSGYGGSGATPAGLMQWLVALESGNLVDEKSSIEMKRLMYVTERRIRYAATPELNDAAVYFKSGSFYKCDREKDPNCGKYKGNVYNYMNSVAIVEQPDGSKYIVALMTNVLGRNSNWDHRALAKNIDGIIEPEPVEEEEVEKEKEETELEEEKVGE